MKSIRGGMGLGDALYLQAVVRHLVNQGERLRVCTAWPEVFRPLGDKVQTVPFTRAGVDLVAHYTRRKNHPTTQLQDMRIEAGIKDPVDLVIDWTPTDAALIERLQAPGRRIVCVQLPRAPMGRTDGFGHELLPDCRVIQRVIDALPPDVLKVQIGAGRPLFKFSGIDVDLADQTSVSQLLDVASIADGFVGYVSFLAPLAESFKKPAMFVWSKLGLRSNTGFIRLITPAKVLERPTSLHVVDNWNAAAIAEVQERFHEALCRRR